MARVKGRSSQNMSTKLSIDRDKFSDQYFDGLVSDISNKLTSTLRSRKEEPMGFWDTQMMPQENSTRSRAKSLARESNPSHLIQPKRPMNAFMVWAQLIRRELHDKFSNVQNAFLSKALGRVWRSLDLEHKEPYVTRAGIIKANHKRAYPNYRYQPRRILEKKARSNSLIGIAPVNDRFNNQPFMLPVSAKVCQSHINSNSSYMNNRGELGICSTTPCIHQNSTQRTPQTNSYSVIQNSNLPIKDRHLSSESIVRSAPFMASSSQCSTDLGGHYVPTISNEFRKTSFTSNCKQSSTVGYFSNCHEFPYNQTGFTFEQQQADINASCSQAQYTSSHYSAATSQTIYNSLTGTYELPPIE